MCDMDIDLILIDCGVEQLAARRAHNPEVAGSSPAPAIKPRLGKVSALAFYLFYLAILLYHFCYY